MAKVIEIKDDEIHFDNGIKLYSEHNQDCCESHSLSMGDLTIEDFDELEFDLESDLFFNRIEGYGIELIPKKGHSVKIPGYGLNNGYYGTNIDLVLSKEGRIISNFDISECQKIEY